MIIGDGSIGKTCLLQRFNYDTFVEDHLPTIFDSHYRSIDHEGRTHSLRLVFPFETDNRINRMATEGASTHRAKKIMNVFAMF